MLRFLCLILVGISSVQAQTGWLDPTFDNDGIVFDPIVGTNMKGCKVVVQADGKIVVLGSVDNVGGTDFVLIRYNSDGSLDPSFGTGGYVVENLASNDIPTGLKIQSDGKILVLTEWHMARYTMAGTLDLTFDTDGWFALPLPTMNNCLDLLSDGRIATASYMSNFDVFSWSTSYAITIYNQNGSLYSSTNSPTVSIASPDALNVAVQDDDKILLFGSASDYSGVLFRVNPNGTPDATYGTSGNGFMITGYPIIAGDFQSDGKLVCLGYSSFFKYTTSGVIEYVGPNIYETYFSAYAELKVLSNDKILVTGEWYTVNDFKVKRLNNNGTPDITFSSDGTVSVDLTGNQDSPRSVAIQSDGKILVTGAANGNFGTMRLDQCYPKLATDVVQLCGATTYTWIDGNTYTSNNNTATHTFAEGASNGCDSIVTLNLTFGTPSYGVDVQSTCGPMMWIDGNMYSSSTNSPTYTYVGGAANGCDSTVTLNLTVTNILNQGISTITPTLCEGANAMIYLSGTQPGIDYYLRDNASNAIVAGPLAGNGNPMYIYSPPLSTTTTFNVYAGVDVFGNGALDFDGVNDFVNIPNDPALNFNANDDFGISAFVKHDGGLGVIFAKMANSNPNRGYDLMVNSNGQVMFQFISNWGFGQAIEVTTSSAVLADGLYHHVVANYDGSQTAAGVQIYVDGVLQTLIATVDNLVGPTVNTENATLGSRAYGALYFDGQLDDISIWDVPLSLAAINAMSSDCLNGYETDLIALYRMNDQTGGTTIDEGPSALNGTLINMDNVNSWVTGFLNCTGCANQLSGTITINVVPASSGTDVQSACGGYLWIDGNYYTSNNNTATWTLANSAGCDSVVTLNLTIGQPTSGTDVQTACGSYQWIDGNTYTSNNNTASYTLTNAAGCDSIVTLDLTILQPTSGTDVQTACGSYQWIDGNTYTANNNTASYTLTNAAGCDSIVTLDLTINALPVATATDNGDGTLSATGTGIYQWIDCANNTPISGATSGTFAPTVNGSYAVIVDNGNCADTSSCATINYLGFDKLSMEGIQLYPNPTSDNVTITFNADEALITLLNAHGQIIRTQVLASGEQISLSDYAPGIYFVNLRFEDKEINTRIIKK